MLESVVASAGLSPFVDRIFSVDAVGAFKTDRRVYQYALEELGVTPSQASFQSSNGWDAYAASDFGFRVVWVNRYGQRPERLPGNPDVVVDDAPRFDRGAYCGLISSRGASVSATRWICRLAPRPQAPYIARLFDLPS